MSEMEESESDTNKPLETMDGEPENLETSETSTVNDTVNTTLASSPCIPEDVPTPTKEGESGDNNSQLPISNVTPSPQTRDPHSPEEEGKRRYRVLYKEMKRVYLASQQSMEKERDELHGKISKYAAESDEWKEKYEAALDESELGKKLDNLSVEYGTVCESNEILRNEMEEMKKNYEKIIAEKDELLSKQSSEINEERLCYGLHKITSEENIVRLKPKSKKAKTTSEGETLSCEYGECGSKNVDLILCNMCNKWVCEDCNDVQVAKLKPILNRCKTIHFLCKKCDEKIGSKPTVEDESAGQPPKDTDLLTSLKAILDKKVTQMESKIEKVIDKKLGDKLNAITTREENGDENDTGQGSTIATSYAKVLEVPAEVRKVLQEVKNDEKVEKSEQEKRSQNFIIHGAEEIGENSEEIQSNDNQYIKDILKKLSVKAEAKSVTRLGQPNEKKMRVLKVVMKTEAEKDSVMANLRKLKGTEEEFGKISVTRDYTSSERDQIKEYTTKAAKQNEEDPTRVYKVRGDPKNGLKIISYKRM